MTSRNWHPEDVKAAIRKKGTAIRDVATAAGVHPSALSHCLHYPVPAGNKAIADFLDRPLHEIWPKWFDEDGQLKPTIRFSRAQRQKRSAA